VISGTEFDISIEEARALAVAAQGLAVGPAAPPDGAEILRMIERIGVLQVDTINVVERSQYLVLWSRLGGYDPALLDTLLYPRRLVFECMAPVALIAPMKSYRYYRPGMLHSAQHDWRRSREWLAENPTAIQDTLEAIRERGPLASADFERPDGAARTGRWDWHGPKPSRRALEILYNSGEIMVHSRRAGQKLYDLRERVLAEAFGEQVPEDGGLPDDVDRRLFFAAHAAEALGIIVPAWLWEYHALRPQRSAGRNHREAALATLERMVAAGQLIPVSVDGHEGPAFLASSLLDTLRRLRGGKAPSRTTLLSPFDSLIWDRARTRSLFGFDVCFEAYVPPLKRKFGYYCLSILHQNKLVGRVDPKMDRASRRLLVRAAYLEPGVELNQTLIDGLAAALTDLARFLGGTGVDVGKGGCAELIEALSSRLLG
jgi:uncharacterized protein YcaQ